MAGANLADAMLEALKTNAFAMHEDWEIGFIRTRGTDEEILKKAGFEPMGPRGLMYFYWRKATEENKGHGYINLEAMYKDLKEK